MKPTLTRQLVAEAGVTIADADGLKALTMRRVASALDVATMAPYRHVTDRDDLLVAMVDVITRDRRTLIDDDMRWDDAVRAVACAEWDAFVAHPWLIEVWSTPRRRVDLGSFDQLEAVLTRLEQADVPPAQCLSVVLGVLGLTLGMAAMAVDRPGPEDPDLAHWWTGSVDRFGAEFPQTHPRSTWFMAHLHSDGGHGAFLAALDDHLAGVATRFGLPYGPGAR
ncbi:TetR/AcrR family transcriptional regulator C-terminal domain-containing protein [Mycolicibacterium mucogenicum]|uniref:TetR/AcrR family transcriptional regulator n=1 Tax=Mycolicibacterium mucogenicum TaxID=56689 RepID=UPI00226A85B5|nr:TetR/AcrR family transcriptional regulator C-terminal domain-containing protein [Mycolicibacterium mucogenicum]MCX8558287.1 TetR/AcrR family transcriptional regulator C-terminal domain-containing protein [Mycolicibacterium mucogenicum]